MSGSIKDDAADRVLRAWWERKTVTRDCLKCEQPFPTRSKANRLCDKCREENEKLLDKTLNLDL